MADLIKGVNPDGEVQALSCTEDGYLNTTAVINVDTVNLDGDGAIVDGADPDVRATVFDYTNSKPVAVILVDETTGDPSSGGASTVSLEEQLDYDSGAGTVAISVVGLALPGSGGPVAGGTTSNPIHVADAGGSLTVDGTVAVTNAGLTELAAAINGSSQMDVNIAAQAGALTVASHAVTNAGTFAVQATSIADGGNSITVDNGGTFAVQSTLQTGSNLAGRVNTDPQTGNGLSIFRSLDLDESEEEVKGSAGAVYGYHFVNRTTSPLYLKFFNDTEANVTVGSTTPVMTLELPANATDHIAGHISFPFGLAFSTAITVAVTTGFADNDAGAPGANAAIIHVFYK